MQPSRQGKAMEHGHPHQQQKKPLTKEELVGKPQELEADTKAASRAEVISCKKMRKGAFGWLREHKVWELVRDKRRLVEVPYTATLAHTVNALLANGVVAVPVAAPPGQWIGAGGSMILESDKVTGAVRKHYIGMVTMLDVLAHIAEDDVRASAAVGADQPERDLDRRMSVPVSSIIGHSLEGLSLWTLTPNTSILDCMETFSKGVHRALVPLESQADNVNAVALVEASPGYRMLTQMDVVSFLRARDLELKDIISKGVQELRAVNEDIFAVSNNTKVIDAIKAMRAAGLNAVPVVEAPNDGLVLINGKGKKLVETFSATDLRGCPVLLLQSWLSVSVVEFKENLYTRSSGENIPSSTAGDPNPAARIITCDMGTSLDEVIELAVSNHVHRVWVVDQHSFLEGLISLSDMLGAVREAVVQVEQELKGVVSPR